MDLRSTHKKAQDIIDRTKVAVSEVDSILTNEVLFSYHDQSTYTRMVHMINAVCKIHKTTDKSFLENRIGFKLLLYRSSCSSWDEPIPYAILKEMKEALNVANKKDRVSNKKKDETVVVRRNVPAVERKMKPNNQVVKKRFSCCSCCASNVADPTLKFLRVPRVGFKNITTDDVRCSYYKALYRRETYLNRLNVPEDKRNVQLLYFCENKHGLIQEERFNIPWIDSK